ncbi:MAG: agmatine deiminase family protein [Bacteroides sp.]|nr:agmatine deiminase family protein [Roseburia sp.]MCM1346274.1 agmatine deiminase family protein [Bacteroides sp.]MCM1420882.1 agmatine deiminase family protein [Bacteroides sp.]
MEISDFHLPAEWAEQELVQLTWPHDETDWASILDEVEECYCNMAREIAQRGTLLIVAKDTRHTRLILERHGIATENIRFFECDTNDTWARDHAFITCVQGHTRLLTDFCFNGWGMKFAANYDNQINRKLSDSGMLEGIYVPCLDFVLEGGAIESDGCGTIMTTSSCLLAPNRNDSMTREDIEKQLLAFFNAKRVLWIQHGYLAGDDTDGHVDTLARLCPDNTIAYMKCSDINDEHFNELQMMEDELKSFRTLSGEPYHLVPLPLPDAVYGEEGERLPATYANFLIQTTDGRKSVIYPTYSQPDNDRIAKEQLAKAFPGYELIGIECSTLIKQHGSLHCCTMQYPKV